MQHFKRSSKLTPRAFTSECDKRGRKRILLIGLVIFFLATLGYLWIQTVLLLLVFGMIHGVGLEATNTTGPTIATDIVPVSRMGEGMGYYGLCLSLATAITPAIVLALAAGYDLTIGF